jgi:hypothetical protein
MGNGVAFLCFGALTYVGLKQLDNLFETMHDNRQVNARAEALKRKALQVCVTWRMVFCVCLQEIFFAKFKTFKDISTEAIARWEGFVRVRSGGSQLFVTEYGIRTTNTHNCL